MCNCPPRIGLTATTSGCARTSPTIADAPSIEVLFVDGADVAANHTGAKGLAEPPIIPTAPAIANAVADALGVEPTELPLTPWRVLELMRRSE